MINILKEYHFYAAHRNELVDDKCKSLHGHTYHAEIAVQFEDALNNSGVTMLFSDIDKIAEPIFKRYDHATLMHKKDPLLSYLEKYCYDYKDDMKIVIMPFPTSAENLATSLLASLRAAGLNVVQIKLKETTSSTVQILSLK